MLIRSNRPFQDGGNGETIVPEEGRSLKDPEERNGGWKTDSGLPGVSLPPFCLTYFPLTLASSISFLLSLLFITDV